jgi:hypothetical protein
MNFVLVVKNTQQFFGREQTIQISLIYFSQRTEQRDTGQLFENGFKIRHNVDLIINGFQE